MPSRGLTGVRRGQDLVVMVLQERSRPPRASFGRAGSRRGLEDVDDDAIFQVCDARQPVHHHASDAVQWASLHSLAETGSQLLSAICGHEHTLRRDSDGAIAQPPIDPELGAKIPAPARNAQPSLPGMTRSDRIRSAVPAECRIPVPESDS